MEKRTILAFVLSFLIFIIWYVVFTPKQEPQIPLNEDLPEATQREVTSAPVATPAVRPAPADETSDREVALTVSMVKEKEIEVDTPLYNITFSNIGATIKSYKLKRYQISTDPESPLIELVNLKDENEDFLSIFFDSRTMPAENRYGYDVDKDAITIVPGIDYRDLTFSYTTPQGLSQTLIFRFYADRYDIDLFMNVENRSDLPVEGNIKASVNNIPPEKKSSYYAFVGSALVLDNKLEQIKPKKMKEDKKLTGKIDWIAYESDYFMSAIIPESDNAGHFLGRLLPSGVINAGFSTPTIVVNPREQMSYNFKLYMGPRDLDILKGIGKNLAMAVDFGLFDIIAKPLHYGLRFFNRYVHNYGLSIIILTILIKILLWPLTHKSYKSMKEMQKIQPLMAKIREKYKNDKAQMQKELMGLYKTYKINPMGGCLPLLLQFPILFAMFRLLGNSIELRHAPFVLWIDDLSAPDRLFHFPFNIPFMDAPAGIPVLTLLMGASMFIQQRMQPTPGADPAQAKMMMFLPVIFTIMFINFPSGLVLYWLISNIITIGQQYGIKKKPG